MSSTNATDLVAELERVLAAQAGALGAKGVRSVSLVGSRARGTAEPESDIDLLLDLAPDATFGCIDLDHLKETLGDALGRKVDIVVAVDLRTYVEAHLTRDVRQVLWTAQKKPRVPYSRMSQLTLHSAISIIVAVILLTTFVFYQGIVSFRDSEREKELAALEASLNMALAEREAAQAVLATQAALEASLNLALAELKAARQEAFVLQPVYFATTRANEGTQDQPSFGFQGDKLVFGHSLVSIPRNVTRRPGEIPRPERICCSFLPGFGWALGLPFEDERADEHFTIFSLALRDRDAFVHEAKQAVAAAKTFERQAFVYVHGFGNTFDTALFRTAQIAYDLRFDGLPVLFSWPSEGIVSVAAYAGDGARADVAETALHNVLMMVRDDLGADVVHLIAHSMGNRPLARVLAKFQFQMAADAAPIFNEIILAAPDIDAEHFSQLASDFLDVAEGFTIYASGDDRALQLSGLSRGRNRMGEIPPPPELPRVVDGVDLMDVTSLGDILAFNHSDYADSPLLMSDIRQLFLDPFHRIPPERWHPPLLEQVDLTTGKYWKFNKP